MSSFFYSADTGTVKWHNRNKDAQITAACATEPGSNVTVSPSLASTTTAEPLRSSASLTAPAATPAAVVSGLGASDTMLLTTQVFDCAASHSKCRAAWSEAKIVWCWQVKGVVCKEPGAGEGITFRFTVVGVRLPCLQTDQEAFGAFEDLVRKSIDQVAFHDGKEGDVEIELLPRAVSSGGVSSVQVAVALSARPSILWPAAAFEAMVRLVNGTDGDALAALIEARLKSSAALHKAQAPCVSRHHLDACCFSLVAVPPAPTSTLLQTTVTTTLMTIAPPVVSQTAWPGGPPAAWPSQVPAVLIPTSTSISTANPSMPASQAPTSDLAETLAPVVRVRLTVNNVDYDKLVTNVNARQAFQAVVEDKIADEAQSLARGASEHTFVSEDVDLLISAGSVQVVGMLHLPVGFDAAEAADLAHGLTNSGSLGPGIASGVAALPQVVACATGTISVVVEEDQSTQASPGGFPFQFGLDDGRWPWLLLVAWVVGSSGAVWLLLSCRSPGRRKRAQLLMRMNGEFTTPSAWGLGWWSDPDSGRRPPPRAGEGGLPKPAWVPAATPVE